MTPRVPRTPLALAAALAAALPVAPPAAAQTLDDVVVSASRTAQRAFDTAASVGLINAAQIQDGQQQSNISEPLARVPGIFALNRQNYAQDLLISSRGFGANSAFGARGIRIFVDGIPGTVADGQGQISHIDLPSADRIEVLRGPFSVIYGNSAGGVISVFTEDGKPGTEITPYGGAGSFGLRKYGAKVSGEQAGINYVADAGSLHSGGYRDHSTADRENENAKLKMKVTEDTSLTFVANRVSLRADDPLGLTAAQVAANPAQAGTGAASFNSRKSVDQTQGGFALNQRIDSANSLSMTPYYGQRHTIQFLATTNNGVIDLTRNYYGMDTKWLHTGSLAGTPLKLVAGVDANENDDHRLTSNNVGGAGSTVASNQDLSMGARNLDAYLQAELRPTERLALTGGIRHSNTTLSSTSNIAAQPSAGSHTYQAFTGMLSAQYYLREDTNAYVSWGRGFDTPTLNQIAYSSASLLNAAITNSGNLGLRAAVTDQWELGIKSEIGSVGLVNLALFRADTTDDIVVAVSSFGRTSYLNAPKTRREGLELSASLQLPMQFQASLAYTALRATVEQDYTGTFSGAATTVRAGSRIPGVPDQSLYAELMWRRQDKSLEFAVEGRTAGKMVANDVNSASSAGYGVMNLRAVARQTSGHWTFTEFARVDNLFDRAYIGSLIVNQSSSQFYEPAPGRNWFGGVKAAYRF